MNEPTTSAKQRAHDGYWVPVIGGRCDSSIFDSEEAAVKAADDWVHRNWHRPDDNPAGYAPPPALCEKGKCKYVV